VTTNDLWFTARGAGLAAMLILTVATSLGALGSVRLRAASVRVILQYLHRTAAVLGLGLIFVHVATLVLDAKSHVSLAGAIIPFAAVYRPNAVALGSIAMYLFLFVAALGLARGRMASSRLGASIWRALHLVAYPAWGIAIVHGLMAGTDRSQRWVVLMTMGCVLAVIFAAVVRALRVTEDAIAPAPARTPRHLTGASR
jgi:DMSO/TMAO reductase YedYZ heme-binding membrane subunit